MPTTMTDGQTDCFIPCAYTRDHAIEEKSHLSRLFDWLFVVIIAMSLYKYYHVSYTNHGIMNNHNALREIMPDWCNTYNL